MRRWLICSLVLFVVGLSVVQHWFVFNTSPSLPRGLYFKAYQQIKPKDIVLVCPPDSPIFREALRKKFLLPGLCPSGTDYLIKQVMATAGDHVSITNKGVRVNGFLLPGSVRQNFQHAQNMNRKLAAKEVLLMTSHPMSFDGRYFGSLHRDTLITPLIPIWVKD